LALSASDTFRIATHPTTPIIEVLILWKALVIQFYLKRLHNERLALDVILLSIANGQWIKDERLKDSLSVTTKAEELVERERLLKKLIRLEREGKL
jgi:hypothetical protein